MALDTRQRKFARLVAAGMKQTDARIAAYGDSYPPATRRTHGEQASRLMRRPEIRAAVEEYAAEMKPADDYRAARERMEANMQKLALEAPDARVRLAASKLLHDIATDREERQHRAGHRTINVAALIDELSELAPGQSEAIDLEVVEKDPGNTTD